MAGEEITIETLSETQLKAIEERVSKVNKGIVTMTADRGKCVICDEYSCPMCGGDAEIDMMTFDYDPYAAGIQAFGIGKDLNAFEDFIVNARHDITAMAAEIRRLQKYLKFVNEWDDYNEFKDRMK